MPRYFFHLRDRAGTLLDIEGSEHRDDTAAGEQAVRHARGLIVSEVRERGTVPLDARIEITDRGKRVIATITFADAVEIDWGGDPNI